MSTIGIGGWLNATTTFTQRGESIGSLALRTKRASEGSPYKDLIEAFIEASKKGRAYYFQKDTQPCAIMVEELGEIGIKCEAIFVGNTQIIAGTLFSW